MLVARARLWLGERILRLGFRVIGPDLREAVATVEGRRHPLEEADDEDVDAVLAPATMSARGVAMFARAEDLRASRARRVDVPEPPLRGSLEERFAAANGEPMQQRGEH